MLSGIQFYDFQNILSNYLVVILTVCVKYDTWVKTILNLILMTNFQLFQVKL